MNTKETVRIRIAIEVDNGLLPQERVSEKMEFEHELDFELFDDVNVFATVMEVCHAKATTGLDKTVKKVCDVLRARGGTAVETPEEEKKE